MKTIICFLNIKTYMHLRQSLSFTMLLFMLICRQSRINFLSEVAI